MSNALRELEEWLDAFKKTDKAIVVEGRKDREALRQLGVKTEVIELNNRALYKVIESIADNHKRVIILTDLDRQGKRLYSILKSGLLERGVEVDNIFREFLFKKTRLRQIEGLAAYMKH